MSKLLEPLLGLTASGFDRASIRVRVVVVVVVVVVAFVSVNL
jgi:hypothetical protein